jgi:hypothetical protein
MMQSMNQADPFSSPNMGNMRSVEANSLGITPYGQMRETDKALLGLDPDEDKLKGTIEGLTPVQADYLAGKVQDEFSRFKGARIIQEKNWIRAHQNCKGVYPGEFDFGSGTSKAFVQITRPKVQTFTGMLVPILMPPGTSVFCIDPDPVAYDPDFVRNLMAQNIPPDQIRYAVQKKAEESSEKITTKVKDGLVQASWASKLVRTVLDCGEYGTSIVMGPLAVETGVVSDPALAFMGEQEEFRPDYDVISPFDFYPDPGARTIEECSSVIVRKIINRSQLRKLRKDPGFKADVIDRVLDELGEGNWTAEWWESIVNISNSQQQMSSPNGRFICLVRWGLLSGRDLQRAGVPGIEEDQLEDEIMAQVWTIGSHVISLRVSELHKDRLPFYVTPFQLVPHTIWGMGIPEMMFDSQDAVNATERAKMDNMALSSRPMCWVNMDRIAEGEQVLELKAGKIIKTRESEVNNSATPPVEFFTPNCHMDVIQAVQDKSLQLSQEQAAMPNMLMGLGGEGMHNRTSSGASMQFNSAITPLKSVVFNFENHLIVPMIESTVKFYQVFSRDQAIKGNHKVSARGVQGIMARETLLNTINTTVQVLAQTPQGAEKLDFDQIGELLIRYNDLVDCRIILPDSVVTQKRQQLAEEEAKKEQGTMQNQVQADKLRAETSPKDALLEAYKGAMEGSLTKLDLLKKVALTYGFMDDELDQAIGYDEDAQHIQTQSAAHGAAMSQVQNEADLLQTHAGIEKTKKETEVLGQPKPKPSSSKKAKALPAGEQVRAAGAKNVPQDTILAHINPKEAAHLKAMGGSGRRDPVTGGIHFDESDDHSRTESQAGHSENEGSNSYGGGGNLSGGGGNNGGNYDPGTSPVENSGIAPGPRVHGWQSVWNGIKTVGKYGGWSPMSLGLGALGGWAIGSAGTPGQAPGWGYGDQSPQGGAPHGPVNFGHNNQGGPGMGVPTTYGQLPPGSVNPYEPPPAATSFFHTSSPWNLA